MFQPLTMNEVKEKALVMRRDICKMTAACNSGHPGSSLSETDIIAVLFFYWMRHDPTNPRWPERDRFILSKGHGVPALYSALSLAGYFPRQELLTLRRINSRLQGHPDMKRLNCIEASTGSLGQGLSVGIGMAFAARIDKKDYRTYVLIGDGESNEGQIWEAAMFAAFHRFDNLTVILDHNRFQLDGPVHDIMNMDPVDSKWHAFGWAVRAIDGHDYDQILDALKWAKSNNGKPSMILANTVKGKGVSFMENNNHFHGVAPNPEELARALKELGEDPALAREFR